MATWDPTRYLSFADERARPFAELLGRVEVKASRIADLGCGPGHLTALLRARWPEATIEGVDSSVETIERATADNADPEAAYGRVRQRERAGRRYDESGGQA